MQSLENNVLFRGVIVAMFSVIMAASGIGISLLVYNLHTLNDLVAKIDVRLGIAESRIDDLRRNPYNREPIR